jgi:hypothetical protein
MGSGASCVGYTPSAAKHHLDLMGQLNGWLLAERLGVGELTSVVAHRFLYCRRAGGQRRVPTLASLVPLIDYLRDLDVLPAEPIETPSCREVLLAHYRHHLVHGRGLTTTTVRRYERFARRFLADRASRRGAHIGA